MGFSFRPPRAAAAILLTIMTTAEVFSAKQLYVSPGGNDGAAGTEGAPLKTLHKARDKVREINDGSDDIIVYLRGNTGGGYHFLDSTLSLDRRDGGKNGHSVTWTAYSGESPVISGGMRIDGWTLHDQGLNIWKASAPVDKKIRTMTVDYFPAIRALGKKFKQGPLWGESGLGGTEGFYVGNIAGRWGSSEDPYEINLHNPADAELYKWDSWLAQQWCVEEQLSTGANAKLKMQQPMWRIAEHKGGGPGEGAELVFENDLSFLDFKNEFYYDRLSKTLYYIPRRGVNMESAVAMVPNVERLVTVQGASPSERVSNISFQGIAFHDDSYQLPEVAGSHGYVGVQSHTAFARPVQGKNPDWKDGPEEYWMGHLQIQSAVEVMFAEDIDFRGCRFEYLGGGGLNYINDVHNSTVDGCIFRWTASHAVSVGHDEHCDPGSVYPQELYPFPQDPQYLVTCSNITVSNNVVRNASWRFTHVPSIMVYFAKDFSLLHNDLGPCGFNTVSIGWGWGNCDDTKEYGGMYAANNVLHTGCKHHGDCGTFYTLGDQHGFVVEENFFPGQWEQTDLTAERRDMVFRQESNPDSYIWFESTSGTYKGFYPDASTSNITYRDNVYEGNSHVVETWFQTPATVVVDGGWYSDNGKGCRNATANNVSSYPLGSRPDGAQAVVDKAGPENKSLYDGMDWTPGKPNPVAIPGREAPPSLSRERLSASAAAGREPALKIVSPRRERLTVTLYDMSGRERGVLFNGTIGRGSHRIPLYADGHGRRLQQGTGSFVVIIRGEDRVVTLPIVTLQ